MDSQKQDSINPKHYQGDGTVDCSWAMESMFVPVENKLDGSVFFWWGNAFKYLWRWPLKNGKEDLQKCERCIELLIACLDNE